MASSGKAEREVLRKARRVFVDFKNVEDAELIRCYFLCNDVFAVSHGEIADDDTFRAVCSRVQTIIESLPPRERIYIKYRYGFMDGVCYSVEQIEKLMQIPANRIVNIKSSALKRIRSKGKCIFAINVIEQLELNIKANEAHIEVLESQIRNLMHNPVVPASNSIDNLEWTPRTYNLLKRNGVHTIEQLLLLRHEYIWQWWGAGRVSIGEILDMQKKILKKSHDTPHD